MQPRLPSALGVMLADAGLEPGDFVVIDESRGRTVLRSEAHRLFIRLDGPGREQRAATEITFTTWAASVGLPVVTPDPRFDDQPVRGEFGAATLWPLLEPVPVDEVDMAWFGQTLRRLHDQRLPLTVEPWQPNSWIAVGVATLHAIPAVGPQLATALASAGETATRALNATADVQLSPIHGDASPDNVVRDGASLLLTDFEKGSVGPAGYDLAPMRMLVRRFGHDRIALEQLLDAYGRDRDPAMDEALTDLFEVVVIAGAIAPYANHPAFQNEVQLRLNSLFDPDFGIRWTAHRALLAKVRGKQSGSTRQPGSLDRSG